MLRSTRPTHSNRGDRCTPVAANALASPIGPSVVLASGISRSPARRRQRVAPARQGVVRVEYGVSVGEGLIPREIELNDPHSLTIIPAHRAGISGNAGAASIMLSQ